MQSILALIMIACLMFMRESNERSHSQIWDGERYENKKNIRRKAIYFVYVFAQMMPIWGLLGGGGVVDFFIILLC